MGEYILHHKAEEIDRKLDLFTAGDGENSIVQKTTNEEEEKNSTIGTNTAAFGVHNIAGSRGFRIIESGWVDEEAGTGYYVLKDYNSVLEGYTTSGYVARIVDAEGAAVTPGDIYSVRINNNFDMAGEIVAIEGNKITVTGFTWEDLVKNPSDAGDANTFRVHMKPFIGTLDIGLCAFANGIDSIAAGRYSSAEGNECKAAGKYAHAEGNRTVAGYAAHSEGNNTQALTWACHAEGWDSIASGRVSHAEGNATTASGLYSHAEGQGTHATGQISHAEGQGTTAEGTRSHAEGHGTTASNEQAHAEGQQTTASGKNSHAEGDNTNATAWAAHAEGNGTTASGSRSHAEGISTQAKGQASHTEGWQTVSTVDCQHVQGRFNYLENKGTENETSGTNLAHVVGWGNSDLDRRNIHTLDTRGNAWYLGSVNTDNIMPTAATNLTSKAYVDNLDGQITQLLRTDIPNYAVKVGGTNDTAWSVPTEYSADPEIIQPPMPGFGGAYITSLDNPVWDKERWILQSSNLSIDISDTQLLGVWLKVEQVGTNDLSGHLNIEITSSGSFNSNKQVFKLATTDIISANGEWKLYILDSNSPAATSNFIGYASDSGLDKKNVNYFRILGKITNGRVLIGRFMKLHNRGNGVTYTDKGIFKDTITVGNTTITESQLNKLLTLLDYTEYNGEVVE